MGNEGRNVFGVGDFLIYRLEQKKMTKINHPKTKKQRQGMKPIYIPVFEPSITLEEFCQDRLEQNEQIISLLNQIKGILGKFQNDQQKKGS